MPIYEYVCTNAVCGHELEALQKMSDDRLVFCPSCGEPTLKRKISAAGFRLKGTGWYETDFKNNGKKPAAKDSSDGGKSEGDKSGGSGADGAAKSADKPSTASSKPSGGGTTEAA